ncbi:putative adipose-regulatory protein-domain-containing protein, partial [Parachaetomium inaequale]
SVGPNPFGIASLEGIANRQPYDITVSLTLPRSPTNLDRGNFMIALHLLSPGRTTSGSSPQKPLPYLPPAKPAASDGTTPPSSWHALDTLLQPTRLDLPSFLASHTIVHTTTRPALIPYVDPLAALTTRVLLLVYHVLAPRAAATVHLTVPMAEDLAFVTQKQQQQRRRESLLPLLPESLLLEVQAGQGIQVYEARVTLVARLGGLRGFMYRWRVTAFVVFTVGFWVGEVGMLAAAVLVVGVSFGGGSERGGGGGGGGGGRRGVGGKGWDYDFEEEGSSSSEDGGEGRGRGKRGPRDVKDGERRVAIKAEASPSSASEGEEAERRAVKKEEVPEEEEEEDLAKVPPFETGQSTEADDEAETEGVERRKGKGKEVKREGGVESKDLGIGTSYSGQGSKEGARRRKVSFSRETS